MEAKKEQIEKVNKFPLAYALMILGGLVGIFANKVFDSSDSRIEALEAEKKQLQITVSYYDKKCDSVVNFWQNKYFKQIEYSLEKERRQDSILQKSNQALTKAMKNKSNE